MGSRSHKTAFRTRTAEIRRFILAHVRDHPRDIARITAEHFSITRQSVNQHLQRLVEEKALISEGHTRGHAYHLVPALQWVKTYELDDSLLEDTVWREDIQPLLKALPDNTAHIWLYGFTGILNNAVDHSGGNHVQVALHHDAAFTEIAIMDDGDGIFRKIQREMGLEHERNAVLEVAKGKFTTDPEAHTGEDIYFISRLFDEFEIFSSGICLYSQLEDIEAWMLEKVCSGSGTSVWMRLDNHTTRTLGHMLDQFTTRKEFGFNKTVVPVRLARDGGKLVSRARARRVLARSENFKKVVLDFSDIENIGPTFADEIFRVFRREHPQVELVAVNASAAVKRMIERARGRAAKEGLEATGGTDARA